MNSTLLTNMKDKNTAIALAIALLFIGASLYFANNNKQNDEIDSKSAVNSGKIVDILQLDSPVLGKEDAKVTIIEFVDFQCPPCATFQFGAGAVIYEQYIKKGLVKLVNKHFPLLGEESFLAAYASECANEQGKFWQYHDYLFDQTAKTIGENSGTFSSSNLVNYAEQVGLNKDKFAVCLNSEKYKNRIVRDVKDGKDVGVTGTPTIFINGKKVEGSAKLQEYQKAIDDILNK